MAHGETNRARLSIGTAQFGLRYGIANQTGQVSLKEASAILAMARSAGVDTLDTAVAYGVSEQTLGSAGVAGWRITSKLPPLPPGTHDVPVWLHESVDASLARLGVSSLHGLLLHRPGDLLEAGGAELAAALVALRDSGKVERVGISIYQPSELDQFAPLLPLGIVQAPFNVFDRRLESSGWLRRLHYAGVEVHTRSAFLQGLLIMPAQRLPPWTVRWGDTFARWHRWLIETHSTPIQACLSFVLSRPEIAHAVVGVDNQEQLRDLLDWAVAPLVQPPADLALADPELLDPSRWPRA